MFYKSIIGLEIHVELKTESKMFCSCPADHFGKKPNTQTCPVCLGLPGALPVPNKKAIEWTILTGLALGCQVPLFSKFDRKNYFYPDLPKGFQISQYDLPFCQKGSFRLENKRTIGITRVHLEEDTGKLLHKTVRGKGVTLIDFNRSGVPLMEIVTEPDLRTTTEVKEFLKKLQQLLRYLGVSDGEMEKGSMRLEANISLRKKDSQELPDYKVEIKNLNSFRFVIKALNYEIERQKKVLDSGKKLGLETRGFNENKGITFVQRVKEEAQDYRYFPEPDTPPIRWKKEETEKIRKSLPELPEEKKEKLIKTHQLSEDYARILSRSLKTVEFFEKTVKKGKKELKPEEIANLIINKRIDINQYSPEGLVKYLVKQKRKVKLPLKEVKKVVSEVLRENKKAVEDFKKGKTTVIEFLVGQVARKTKGQADPNQTRKILLEKLK